MLEKFENVLTGISIVFVSSVWIWKTRSLKRCVWNLLKRKFLAKHSPTNNFTTLENGQQVVQIENLNAGVVNHREKSQKKVKE